MINLRDASGRTPLHWAAMTDRVDFVHALIEKGAQKDLRDVTGRTPLFCAAAFGAHGAVRVLVEKGAEKHEEDERGEKMGYIICNE